MTPVRSGTQVDWEEIDRRLAAARKRGSGAGLWSDEETDILRRALDNGYTQVIIHRSGILPDRTYRAIRSKIYDLRHPHVRKDEISKIDGPN